MAKTANVRQDFDKALQSAVATRLKGSRWRKRQDLLFCEKSGMFCETQIAAHNHKEVSTARISVKPMTLDPAYWGMVGLSQNNAKPLSFRAWGAYTCSSIPVHTMQFADRHRSPDDIDFHSIAAQHIQNELAL